MIFASDILRLPPVKSSPGEYLVYAPFMTEENMLNAFLARPLKYSKRWISAKSLSHLRPPFTILEVR